MKNINTSGQPSTAREAQLWMNIQNSYSTVLLTPNVWLGFSVGSGADHGFKARTANILAFVRKAWVNGARLEVWFRAAGEVLAS